MVRAAVISDTHGQFGNLEKARAQLGQVDWLLHAGDHLQDAERVARVLGVEPGRTLAVIGNCDYPLSEPAQLVTEIEGVRILLTHGHHYGVKSTLERIYYRARELNVRVAIFGHSHVPVLGEDHGLLLFNPGSLSQPRLPGDPPSCGLLELEQGQVQARHIYLR